uniref:Uncharacterized protein n=1 Tax=Rhipicephalus appendiculatus TaxID=34631 RepID=A0A131YIC5_RHIAP
MEKGHLQICEELGVYAGSAKTREAILEVMEEEDVTFDEAEELWELITDIRLEAKQREMFERAIEQRKREARLLRRTELLESLECELSERESDYKLETYKWWDARKQLRVFQIGEDVVSFLADFEEACEKQEVSRDYWLQRLIQLLPQNVGCVVERMFDSGNRNFDEAKKALFDHIATGRLVDCESLDDEALRIAQEEEALRMTRDNEARQGEQGADFEGQKKGAIHNRDRSRGMEGETSEGEPASLESVGCTVLSEAQTHRNDPEDKLVKPPGALAFNVESSVLVSTSAEAVTVPRRPERKRRRRKRKANAKHRSCHKRAEVGKRQALGSQKAHRNVRPQIVKRPTGKRLKLKPEIPKKHAGSPKLRVPLRSRLGFKRVAKQRMSKKCRLRSGRLVSFPSVQTRRRSKARCRVHGTNDKSRTPPWRKGNLTGRHTMGKRNCRYACLSEFGARRTKVTATECFGQVSSLSLRQDLTPRKLWNARPPRARLKGCRIQLSTV